MKARRQLVLWLLVLLVVALGVAVWMALRSDPGSGPIPIRRGVRTTAAEEPEPSAEEPAAPAPERRYGVPGTLTGELRRRADESPVVGQRVLLTAPGTAPRETQTDTAGVFEFDGVPRAVRHTLAVRAEGFAPVVLRGTRLGRHRRLDVGTLWLSAAAHAVVGVRSSRGEWLTDAVVEAYRVGRGATSFEAGQQPESVTSERTDDEGIADFGALSAGTWVFVARARGHERRSSGSVTLHGGTGVQHFTITLGPERALRGRVLSRAGEPLASVEVVALRRTLVGDSTTAPLSVRAWSNAHGEYELAGLPTGDIVLWAARPGWPLWVAAAVRLPGVERLDLVLPDPSRLAGRVLEAEGEEPVTRVQVTATFTLPLGITVTSAQETDDAGRFLFAFPGAGTLGEVVVERPGSFTTLGGTQPATLNSGIAEGETAELEVLLVAGTRLTGIVSADGQPVRGARVVAVHPHETRDTYTDRSGRYSFSALRAGDVQIAVTRWGFAQADGRGVSIPSAGTVAEVVHDVTLSPGATLRGAVVDAAGAALAGVEVCVVGEENAWCATTDAAGAFLLERVTPGAAIELIAEKPGFSPAYARAGPDDLVVLRMQPLLRIRGTVHGPGGDPPRDAVVQAAGTDGGLHPIDAEWGWLRMDRMSVEPDGTFDHLVSIVDDAFIVRAAAPGRAPALSRLIAVEPGRTEYDVDLFLAEGERVAGRVVDERGRPVAGAWVSLVGVAPGEGTDALRYPGSWGPPVASTADGDGRFAVGALLRGRYVVLVRAAGFGEARVVVETPESDVRVRLPKLGGAEQDR